MASSTAASAADTTGNRVSGMANNWRLFRSLCRVIGGQDKGALRTTLQGGTLPQLVRMAHSHGVLPALALRIDELPEFNRRAAPQLLALKAALRDNTRRNMQALMQALKLARSLNNIGITPTFLKGTALLLTANKDRLGFRTQQDIDLVLAPDELESACEALLGMGYGYCYEFPGPDGQPKVLHDTGQAFKISAAHHHLPPLVIKGYASSVELHRHFLPARFQHSNPLGPLLDTAVPLSSHGAAFRVPSAEYQLIHLILGKMINDGYLARGEFPLREGADYIALHLGAAGQLDEGLVTRHCGKSYAIFAALVAELMAYIPEQSSVRAKTISCRLKLMEKRHNSALLSRLLDSYARTLHLGNQLFYSPAKLPAYLRRRGDA